jgi:hypothetical protein
MRTYAYVLAAGLALFSANTAQGQATVCKDKTTTASPGKGTCSGHGGVDAAATAAAKKAAQAEKKASKAENKTAKTSTRAADKTAKNEAKTAEKVTCSDGTLGTPGRGACSGHGGVKRETAAPRLPASVPANSPARTNSNAKSKAPSATNAPSNRGDDDDPTDALAQCNDGKYSHATNHRGACSKHGGVKKFFKPE